MSANTLTISGIEVGPTAGMYRWRSKHRGGHRSDKRLTPVQARALLAIADCIRERGIAPTGVELCDRLDICQGAVGSKKSFGHRLFLALEKKGFVARDRQHPKGGARTVRVIRDHVVVRLGGMP
jgi:hypothetical protein